MSQKRVITGSDDRGRPISRWEDREPVPTGYGFMEPAFDPVIERRQATPDEMAAARARETPEPVKHRSPAPVGTVVLRSQAERMQVSRMRGAARHVEVTGKRKVVEPPERTEEGDPMSTDTEPRVTHGRHCRCSACERQDWTDPNLAHCGMHGPSCPAVYAPIDTAPLQTLASAATRAQEAWSDLTVAEAAWDIARAALSDAMAECLAIIDPDSLPAAGVTEPDVPERTDSQPATSLPAVVSEPATLAVVRPNEAANIPRAIPRQPGHHPSHAGQLREREARAKVVTEAVARHGGDRKAAAAELGMRLNAVTMVVKHADRRNGVEA